ncbi:MAG: hypothetical protein IPL83_08610 [Bdellovibrionales bacterium]|nr:hypothetical protein [Bdellovibrionales bacterium]
MHFPPAALPVLVKAAHLEGDVFTKANVDATRLKDQFLRAAVPGAVRRLGRGG